MAQSLPCYYGVRVCGTGEGVEGDEFDEGNLELAFLLRQVKTFVLQVRQSLGWICLIMKLLVLPGLH